MIIAKRLWRTTDDRLVEDGHPDAAFLAYTAGQEVPDRLAAELGLPGAPAGGKARTRPADKAAAAAANKSAATPEGTP